MAKYKYTAEQDKWLIENAPLFVWERLAEKFEKEFGVHKNYRTLKAHCTAILKCAPYLNGHEKGQRNCKTLPLGSEYTDKFGFTVVKVSDRPISRKDRGKNWISKGKVMWEKHNGKRLPNGFAVCFVNGNNQDFSAENLLAVPLSVEGKLGNFKKEKLSAQMNKVYALNEYCNKLLKEITENES